MYAVIETGGRQYRVREGDEFETEKLKTPKGDIITLDRVLLLASGKRIDVGRPYLKGTSLICEVISQHKGKKTIAFKIRRRKGSKSKIGHRQELTRLKVKEIRYGT